MASLLRRERPSRAFRRTDAIESNEAPGRDRTGGRLRTFPEPAMVSRCRAKTGARGRERPGRGGPTPRRGHFNPLWHFVQSQFSNRGGRGRSVVARIGAEVTAEALEGDLLAGEHPRADQVDEGVVG